MNKKLSLLRDRKAISQIISALLIPAIIPRRSSNSTLSREIVSQKKWQLKRKDPLRDAIS
jgi:hypothetical protein